MSPYATYTLSGPWVPTLPTTAIHPWHPYISWCPLTAPTPHRSPQCPLMPHIPLLATEYLHSPASLNTPLHPWCPLTPPNGHPTPLEAPNAPLCHLYPFWPLSTYTPCLYMNPWLLVISSFIVITNDLHLFLDHHPGEVEPNLMPASSQHGHSSPQKWHQGHRDKCGSYILRTSFHRVGFLWCDWLARGSG